MDTSDRRRMELIGGERSRRTRWWSGDSVSGVSLEIGGREEEGRRRAQAVGGDQGEIIIESKWRRRRISGLDVEV